MKPLLRLSVSLGTLAVLCSVVQIAQAGCGSQDCKPNETATLTTTNTTVTLELENCSISIDNKTYTESPITNLVPGTVYQVFLFCHKCCIEVATRPGKIKNPIVSPNTTFISLNWSPPDGNVAQYMLEWHNGGAPMSRLTYATSLVLPDLLPGINYTITIIALGQNNDTGDPFITSAVTIPSKVKNLTITDVTTSSVSLQWTKPEGNATSYIVEWSPGNQSEVTETSFTIIDLTPGILYHITVVAVAQSPSNKGKSCLQTTFTRPEQPENISIRSRGTDNLSISWTLPKGTVEHYVVNISNEDLKYSHMNKTSDTEANFTGLYPGRVYDIIVTAVAGKYNNVSDQRSFATYPTPPGSINITQRTNSSLTVNWTTPTGMEGAPNISYHITYLPNNGEIKTSANTEKLSPLSSGTSYNITVETVGPEKLRSTIIHNSYFTLPNPVLNLVASPDSTTSLNVTWSKPLGSQTYYKYLIKTNLVNTTVQLFHTNSSMGTNIPDLQPGTRYRIDVTTIAAPGSESTVEVAYSYTMPEAVNGLEVVNVTSTSIHLTWLRQSDHKSTYHYLVKVFTGNTLVWNDTTRTESYTITDLNPGTLYNLSVFTVVEGVQSTANCTSSYTKPEAVSNITAIGTTTEMQVTWKPPAGQVASYSVFLYRDHRLVGNATLNNTIKTYRFRSLTPGVLYCVNVVTKSGPFEIRSSYCNATFPNPPGPIAAFQTVGSINFTWPLPAGMDHQQYNFSVFTLNNSSLTENNWLLLDNLQSGSLYNISVVTVGVLVYESTAVTSQNYTKPYPVTKLRSTEITTDTVTLQWTQPEEKSHYLYVVQASNGSLLPLQVVSTTNCSVPGLLSGSNYSFTVTTETADGTQAAPETQSYFTRPYSIGSMTAETLSTTAILLKWGKPLEYKPEYTYRVETEAQNETVKEAFAPISKLSPGTNWTFCVFVRAANGIEGASRCTSQYTMPVAVQPSISSCGSNRSVFVSWTAPPGEVETYEVHLNGSSITLNRYSTFHIFGDLSAGQLYTAMVTVYSGPFNASSAFVTNATFPNPPGPIEILMKTNSSIEIMWEEAPLMIGATFQYWLGLNTSHGEYVPATHTNHTFSSLLSGTPYNISVATVGAMGFESEKVQIHMVTTRPFSVMDLKTTTAEKQITVMWINPDEYKESYRYNVTCPSCDEFSSSLTASTSFTVDKLTPGKPYELSVTTETSDGTQGTPRWISSCTKASPIRDVKCTGPNTKNAKVILSWTVPIGQHSDFWVAVNDGVIVNSTIACCNYTVSNLSHNTAYKVDVWTRSCGLSSTPVTCSCRTGITNPPVPEIVGPLVPVTATKYDMFTIQVDNTLLNTTSGPITHIGVLVTTQSPGDDSNLTSYLGTSYDQWKAKETPAYLATVKTATSLSRSTEKNIYIDIGDGSVWEGYNNGGLDYNHKYYYAIALFTSLSLENQLVNPSTSLVSVTKYIGPITLPTNPVVIGLAVGLTLAIFCILFLVLIGFIIYWKRLSNKESPDIQIHSMRAKVSVAVRVEDFEAYYRKQKADSNCGFAEEFEDLKPVGTGQSKAQALTVENKPKNRYNNVLPYDSSRVKLSIIHGSPYDDYINANYMPGYNSRKEYIAAQGPLPTTVNDFWRMIWEKNVQTLVMLTRCNEQGRVKCEKYWDSGTKHFENITVTTTSEISLEDWTIRDFDIKNVKTAETRSVRHFHFTAWPDHGVPETTELLISFRHLVREHMYQYSRHSPTVVHCSAGVGRTGTFIAIDRLIFQIERENIVDVYGIIHDLRMHRPLMVQTEDQYVFLNQCAMDIIRSRTGTNVDLIYQNTAALSIYENVEPQKGFPKNGFRPS